MQHCYFHHLASKDPYMDAERLQWTWTPDEKKHKPGLLLEWTHGRICFRGDLNMYINTKRKVGNINFLELPHIKMEWKMDWLTGDNKTGHNVFPCPSQQKGFDAYADFRSKSLDLRLTIECKHINGIRVLLFSTSLRWLDIFWKSITDVSRPIKVNKAWELLALFSHTFKFSAELAHGAINGLSRNDYRVTTVKLRFNGSFQMRFLLSVRVLTSS